MSLPYSTPDLEEGFRTPFSSSKNRPFASSSSFNWNPEPTVPPPKVNKGKSAENQPRDPLDEDYDSDNSTPQQRRDPPEPPVSGYGLHNTANRNEPTFNRQQQEPEQQTSSRIIKHFKFAYDGNNFMKFLTRFERAAKACKATDYDKALQIGQFMKTEELLTQLEAMDGYDTYNWATLQKEMIERWGEFDDITSYTTTNLVNLVEEFSREDEILSYHEFQMYLQIFSEILNELVRNKDLKKRRDASLLFISAFPQRIQNNIRQTLIKNGQLPTGLDGISLPPLWKHVTEVAEMQIRLENDYLERILTCKAPNCHPKAEQSIEDLVKEVASLKKQIMELRPPVIYKHSPPVAPLEPVVDFTEPEIDVFEPATDIMGPGTYYEEPKMGITETTLKEATTTVLPDLVTEWKAASVNLMDTATELLHTVIDIPEMEVDKLDIFQSTKTSEVLDQSVQIIETLDQPTRINKNYVQFLLTENLTEDLEFPKAPKILWIQNINKHKPKLFNKQLFKPYLDSDQLSQDINNTPQNLESEKNQNNSVLLATKKFKTMGSVSPSQILTLPISNSTIVEETFVIPPKPSPPDITTTRITILEEQNQLTPLVEDSISRLSHFGFSNKLFLLFFLLIKLLFQLPQKIPPDHFGQLYATFKPHRILVGVG
ncbi:uncharacterized protein PGTG_20547 [Puccinia graminis f. sp. tritici CRL 75-36-700-3]|uniref:Uncharacterized protein n=1 Tax=Puccinia graminis f. sp. tritici (strain CRL 75-36-700-3 / race SCCL) TaxID=418459 RepID=E3NYE2_PUCGT|nr:uncharacterized protein PGTG_20547 [Puccinia graminis f. sp. tritici CRL 75-36-700-3]EFP94591.2 hypothetical protein PGTG_20547 [Puccinia graminis f. sp. tritici CRL 75-36-700-3]